MNNLSGEYGLLASQIEQEHILQRNGRTSTRRPASFDANKFSDPTARGVSFVGSQSNLHCPVLGHYDPSTPRNLTPNPSYVDEYHKVGQDVPDHPIFGSTAVETSSPDENIYDCDANGVRSIPDVLRSTNGHGFNASLTPVSVQAVEEYQNNQRTDARQMDSNCKKLGQDKTDAINSTTGAMMQSGSNRSLSSNVLHGNLPLVSMADSTIFATIQGIMSGCYEGLGVAIGAFVSGHLIQDLGFKAVWTYGSLFALVIFAVNVSIDLTVYIVCRVRKSRQSSVCEGV